MARLLEAVDFEGEADRMFRRPKDRGRMGIIEQRGSESRCGHSSAVPIALEWDQFQWRRPSGEWGVRACGNLDWREVSARVLNDKTKPTLGM